MTGTTDKVLLDMQDVSIPAPEGHGGPMLSGVNWQVLEGDYWAVAGKHGTGKSDLLEVIAGLARPAGGRICLFGKDITDLEAEEWLIERLRMGYVFGDGGRVFHQMTVVQNITLPLCYHYDADEAEMTLEVQRLLQAAELESVQFETPNRISRSLRQRVALVRALALKPDLLLLDNPVSGMDPMQMEWWKGFLKKLSTGHPVLGGKRLTLVVTVASLRPWLDQATQFAVLDKGEWCKLGNRQEREERWKPAWNEMLN
jgi:ABC-type transporter Mla maintaining outer membrane lipid asymmetry ATPase subunit MlaF